MVRPLSLALRPASRLAGRRDNGQALVEFALILPVLALITLVAVDFGRVFYTYEALANAAREGARYCALQHVRAPASAATNTTGTRTRVTEELDGTVAGVDISQTSCTILARGEPVLVSAAANVALITPFMGKLLDDSAACVAGNPLGFTKSFSTLCANTPVRVFASATMVVW